MCVLHFSARLPEAGSVLVTPGYGPSVPPPAWLRKEDLVEEPPAEAWWRDYITDLDPV